MLEENPNTWFFCIKDVAWLGGLLEGEGCFVGIKGCPEIRLAMTDRDTVERAAQIMQSRVTGPHARTSPTDKPHWKARYFTWVAGRHAVGWMMMLFPFFGERRQQKIMSLLHKWKQIPVKNALKTHCPEGHPFSKENTLIRQGSHGLYRQCRLCVAANKKVAARRQNISTYQASLERRRKRYHESLGHNYTSLQERKEQKDLCQISLLI